DEGAASRRRGSGSGDPVERNRDRPRPFGCPAARILWTRRGVGARSRRRDRRSEPDPRTNLCSRSGHRRGRLPSEPWARQGGGVSAEGLTEDEITARVRAVIRSHARLPVDIGHLADDADLFQAGMTSHASVNVMLALEETFDLEFPDSMLTRR